MRLPPRADYLHLYCIRYVLFTVLIAGHRSPRYVTVWPSLTIFVYSIALCQQPTLEQKLSTDRVLGVVNAELDGFKFGYWNRSNEAITLGTMDYVGTTSQTKQSPSSSLPLHHLPSKPNSLKDSHTTGTSAPNPSPAPLP